MFVWTRTIGSRWLLLLGFLQNMVHYRSRKIQAIKMHCCSVSRLHLCIQLEISIPCVLSFATVIVLLMTISSINVNPFYNPKHENWSIFYRFNRFSFYGIRQIDDVCWEQPSTKHYYDMMMQRHGNAFHITDPLWGVSTGSFHLTVLN